MVPVIVNTPPQMINQRLLVIALYLPHLMSAEASSQRIEEIEKS